ncbi:MAG: hypothetical protein K8R68_03525 [Bacteroidales bacterium]|nr:hypothetical protein [Bacteroidales bacterium]
MENGKGNLRKINPNFLTSRSQERDVAFPLTFQIAESFMERHPVRSNASLNTSSQTD